MIAIAPNPHITATHPHPKRQRTAELQDASRFSWTTETPPGFGVRQCSAALDACEAIEAPDPPSSNSRAGRFACFRNVTQIVNTATTVLAHVPRINVPTVA
jgi:hypothetical protein